MFDRLCDDKGNYVQAVGYINSSHNKNVLEKFLVDPLANHLGFKRALICILGTYGQ